MSLLSVSQTSVEIRVEILVPLWRTEVIKGDAMSLSLSIPCPQSEIVGLSVPKHFKLHCTTIYRHCQGYTRRIKFSDDLLL